MTATTNNVKTANIYKVFWLTCFRNRTKVPFDQFIYNLSLYAQINASQDFLRSFINEFLRQKLIDSNYEVDLANDGAKLIKLVVNGITYKTINLDELEHLPWDRQRAVRAESFDDIARISESGFDLIEILNDFIHPLKVGNRTKITTSIT